MGRKEMRVSLCLFLLLVTLSAFGQQSATNNAAVVPPLINFSGTLTRHQRQTADLHRGRHILSLQRPAGSVTALDGNAKRHPDRNGRYSVQLGATSSIGLPADIFVAAAGPQIAASWRPCPSRPVSPPSISVAG
jgi:hypothetical protein